MDQEESWQAREMRRDQIIKDAVHSADLILINGTDGSEEELNYLTARVASKFVEKALYPFQSALMKKEMLTNRRSIKIDANGGRGN